MAALNRVFLALCVLAICPTSPAFATGGISCTGNTSDDVFINIATGRLPVLNVLGMRASDGINAYAMDDITGSVHLAFGQGLFEPDRIAVDFTDMNVERIVISLRVDISGNAGNGYPGQLQFENENPVNVLCELE